MKRLGDEVGKYVDEKLFQKKAPTPKPHGDIIMKELTKDQEKNADFEARLSRLIARAGKKIYMYNIIYRMFRSPEYYDRYEDIPIQLDTPTTTPRAGLAQRKNGYQFTMNDRFSYFDWFNAYFEVEFKVVQDAANRIAMIIDAASLIADVQVKQNGKVKR